MSLIHYKRKQQQSKVRPLVRIFAFVRLDQPVFAQAISGIDSDIKLDRFESILLLLQDPASNFRETFEI